MKSAENTRLIHYVELLLHAPFPVTEHQQLQTGESRADAIKRLVRIHGSELTALVFYDKVELLTAGLTFISVEQVNVSQPVRFC